MDAREHWFAVADIAHGQDQVLLLVLDILEAMHVEHPPGRRQA
jgi:hypothetical protein